LARRGGQDGWGNATIACQVRRYMWSLFRSLFGRRSTDAVGRPANCNTRVAGSHDEFNAQELLQHLQENEGYAVYEFFEAKEGKKGVRVVAPRHVWNESLEDMQTPPSESSSDIAPSLEESGRASTDQAVKSAPWVVLEPSNVSGRTPSTASSLSTSRSSGKGVGKGRAPPPPPRNKAKGPLGQSSSDKLKALAKATAAPPLFGKRLHWKPLPEASLGDTIFEELRPWGEVVPDLDKEQLERLFAPAQRASSPSGNCDEGGHGKGGSGCPAPSGSRKSGTQVCLLDAKRAQNLAIALRQVSPPTEELAEVLRWMRVSSPVSTEVLEHVYENLVPSLEECPELATYDGPSEVLRDVERQLLPLARLNRRKARLRTMMFSKNMPSLHSSILTRIHLLRSACEQVRSSATLRLVLEMALRVGNYLNHGVEAPDVGGVRGIAIDSLLKLREFRASQGGEASALHCIAVHLLPHHPTLLQQLRAELQAILDPGDAGISSIMDGGISELHDSAGRFQSEIDLVQGEMDRFSDFYRLEGEASVSEGIGPLAVLQRLLEDSREIIQGIEEELNATLATARQLLEYFGERGGWAKDGYGAVDKFFHSLKEFIQSFEECWKEVLDNPRKLRIQTKGTSSDDGALAIANSRVAQNVGGIQKPPQSQTLKINGDVSEGSDALAGNAVVAMARRRKSNIAMRDFGPARLQSSVLVSQKM